MDLEKVNEFLEGLDWKSREIVLFMAKRGHAKIRELSCAIAAENDACTLMKVKGVINKAAEETLGGPALQFEESRIDNATGENVFFSWWLSRGLEFLKAGEMLDIFDEGRHLRVVADLPGIDAGSLRLDLRGSVLSVIHDGSNTAIPLPTPAKSIVSNSYKNNVLEIKLEKLTEGVNHA